MLKDFSLLYVTKPSEKVKTKFVRMVEYELMVSFHAEAKSAEHHIGGIIES